MKWFIGVIFYIVGFAFLILSNIDNAGKTGIIFMVISLMFYAEVRDEMF